MNQAHLTQQQSRDPSPVSALDTELAAAREQLDRVTAEYQAVLSDSDTIQEDRDSVALLVAEARAAVSRIETALNRIGDGSYGRCVRCGSTIPAERLEVLPDTSTCVSCA
jgi:RNA polymerase-binding transcription factor DksA